MAAQSVVHGDAWRIDRGPFIFSGVPPLCVGALDLINESDEKIKVKTIPVDVHEDQTIADAGLGELRVGARLAPRHRTRTRAHFVINPHTPPGTYTADLCCGSQRESIIVHVWENMAVRIDPSSIRLRGAGGDVLKRTVVVSNGGNVTETIREVALVFLEELNWLGRSLAYAGRETDAEDGHQAYMDRVVKELKNTMVNPARVTLSSKVSELHPGDSLEVALQIKLPHELAKGRMYFGSTPFMSSRLNFRVECDGAANSAKRRPR